MSEQIAIFSDLDDTLYNWLDVYAQTFQAMVTMVCQKTLLEKDIVVSSFSRAYMERGSIEYPYITQELDIWDLVKWPMARVLKEVVEPIRTEVNYIRRNNLRLFPHVIDTLEWIRKNDILLFALTMAPSWQAHKRLMRLKIDQYFKCMIVYLAFDVPDYAPQDVKKMNKDRDGVSPSKITTTKVFKGKKKPDPEPVLSTIREYNLDPNHIYLVGDSVDQDVFLAQQAKVIDVWARYGKEKINPQILEIIRSISTRTPDEAKRNEEIRKTTKPTYSIDDFSQLTDIIESRRTKQLQLPFT